MISHARVWIVGMAAVGLTVSLLSSGSMNAADDKTLIEGVQKVAGAFEKKDADGAKKMAGEIAKKVQMEDLMHLFALRTKKGLGVGSKPGAVTPDGLERKLTELAKKPLGAKELGDESQALTEMGYSMAALACVAGSKPPEKDEGKKKKKDWVTWSDELREASLQLATAAKDKKAADLHKAATKADGACTKCHDVFRD
jgi:hypothetical protein